ncbi:MAG: nucleotide-binding protein [Myxococcota bacterium]
MAPAPMGNVVEGTVAEVIQVPNYTYLRLKGPAGEVWAAISSNPSVREGQQVRLASATEMTGFTSKSLGRTFDSIYFGELEGAAAPMGAAPTGAQGLPPGHPPMGGSPGGSAAGALAAVEQAGSALSLRVTDVFSERAVLNGKKVRVAGVATKVTAVQGAWYVHLKDGSGTPGKDDDLTVITSSEVKADAKVTVEGRVALDKDVGMGTPYPVVVENATVVGN